RNENVSNNLLDPSGHLRTFVAWFGSQLAPRRWNDQSIEFGSAITGYDRRVSNLGVRFCHGRTAAVVGEPGLSSTCGPVGMAMNCASPSITSGAASAQEGIIRQCPDPLTA